MSDAAIPHGAGPRVPRMQVVTAHNQRLAAENDAHVITIRGIREQLRGLNRRNAELVSLNLALQVRIRNQLRMLDEYRTLGFRRSVFTPMHVVAKRAAALEKRGAAFETLAEWSKELEGDPVPFGPIACLDALEVYVGAIEGTE